MIDSIRYRWEFRLLRESGRYRRSGPLAVRMALDPVVPPSDQAGGVRVAFAIGRPVGNAVVRNRVRRRLRELIRSLDADSAIPNGRYLLLVSSDAPSAPFDELREHVKRLFSPVV